MGLPFLLLILTQDTYVFIASFSESMGKILDLLSLATWHGGGNRLQRPHDRGVFEDLCSLWWTQARKLAVDKDKAPATLSK